MTELDPGDREFFRLVSRAAFANPFGDERDRLDVRIARTPGDDPDLLTRLIARVEERLSALEAKQALRAAHFEAQDWELIEHAVLFEAFHRFAVRFDELIAEQLQAGATSLAVTFADSVLGRLTSRGIERARAIRMLSLFWQMRRAYYFIANSLTGRAPSMRRLREAIWNDVFTHDLARFERLLWDRLEDFSVILQGETGTGKGQAAAAIGRSGFIPFDEERGRFRESFTELLVSLNLSQFPETLIESELFGHKKGAFTGAVDAHPGVFARCSPQGAIFLDEIGEVDPHVQIKLLRVLQERVFAPVGSHEERRFEGRVIAATHRDLEKLRADKRFRDDFYYRLCSDVIVVPPLRQRLAEDPGELDVLLAHLVARIVGAPDAQALADIEIAIRTGLGEGYAWPGNVRELEQCVRRVLLTGRCEPDRGHAGGSDGADELARAIRAGTLQASALVEEYCALLYDKAGTYEDVAKLTGLDRRTVRKYVVKVRGQSDDVES
ncbi:MAG: sigma 54-interacting transcriptional regulator [Sandaracinaceae bacterium]|nr:sigma 54-interacting transcriptional regulator [Sandaracinaceae bacterium]